MEFNFIKVISVLDYTETEASQFINRHFANNTNKETIKEFFIWVWNDSNLANAKYLTLQKFN